MNVLNKNIYIYSSALNRYEIILIKKRKFQKELCFLNFIISASSPRMSKELDTPLDKPRLHIPLRRQCLRTRRRQALV
jgi:hypothetical protein